MNDEDRNLLIASGCCYEPEEGFIEQGQIVLNMNDTFGWAVAWGQPVPEDKIGEVARLFRLYGLCGLIYWTSEQNDGLRSEFHDINRYIDFVRAEEKFVKDMPDDTKRAYKKHSYVLGIK